VTVSPSARRTCAISRPITRVWPVWLYQSTAAVRGDDVFSRSMRCSRCAQPAASGSEESVRSAPFRKNERRVSIMAFSMGTHCASGRLIRKRNIPIAYECPATGSAASDEDDTP